MFDPTSHNLDLVAAEVAYRHRLDVPRARVRRTRRRHLLAPKEKS